MNLISEYFEFSPILLNKSNDEYLLKSISVLEKSRQINIFITVLILTFGLVGNVLIFLVFCQKRFRKNSSNIFLLCLALNDSLFLIIHFFENTIRSVHYVYILGDSSPQNGSKTFNSFIQIINIMDKSDLSCRFFNYLRQVRYIFRNFSI
jgi:hypothetical protein